MKYMIELTEQERKLLDAFMITTTNELNLFKTAKFEPVETDPDKFIIGDEVFLKKDGDLIKYLIMEIDKNQIVIVGRGSVYTVKPEEIVKTGKNRADKLDNLFNDEKSTPSCS